MAADIPDIREVNEKCMPEAVPELEYGLHHWVGDVKVSRQTAPGYLVAVSP